MFRSKLSAITLALAAAGCCVLPVWAAQQTPEAISNASAADPKTQASSSKKQTKEDIEVIEVKSYSGSLIKSLNLKRFNDTAHVGLDGWHHSPPPADNG